MKKEIDKITRFDLLNYQGIKFLETKDVLIWANAFYYSFVIWIDQKLKTLKFNSKQIKDIIELIGKTKLNVEHAILFTDCQKEKYLEALKDCSENARFNQNIKNENVSNELKKIQDVFLECEKLYRKIRNRLLTENIEFYNNFMSIAILYNYKTINKIEDYYNMNKREQIKAIGYDYKADADDEVFAKVTASF